MKKIQLLFPRILVGSGAYHYKSPFYCKIKFITLAISYNVFLSRVKLLFVLWIYTLRLKNYEKCEKEKNNEQQNPLLIFSQF